MKCEGKNKKDTLPRVPVFHFTSNNGDVESVIMLKCVKIMSLIESSFLYLSVTED